MSVNLGGQYDPNAEASSGNFDPMPAGEYIMVIDSTDRQTVAKNSEEKGYCLVVVWKVVSEEYNGRLVWQRLNLWGENMKNIDQVINISNQQFAAIRQATGVQAPVDSAELHGIPCRVRVKLVPPTLDPHTKQEIYPAKNEVGGVKPLEEHEPSPAQRQAPAPRTVVPNNQQPAAAATYAQTKSGGKAAPWAK